PSPERDDPVIDGSNATTSGGEDAGEAAAAARRQFWRAEYGADEFASVRRASERVTLNLSGTCFVTTRDTLARNPHTYFAAMLRMQPPTTPGSAISSGYELVRDGSLFLPNRRRLCFTDFFSVFPSAADRSSAGQQYVSPWNQRLHASLFGSARAFRFILNYLRDSYIGLDSFGKEDLHFLEELSHEAQFFNIGGLCSDISRRMSDIAKQHREGPSGDKDFRLVNCPTGQIQDVFHEWVIEKNYEFECMQIVENTAYIVLGRRVSRGELALVERLMKT
ncbi:unnamed protein product, partial [Scytosiphon promiscuus]